MDRGRWTKITTFFYFWLLSDLKFFVFLFLAHSRIIVYVQSVLSQLSSKLIAVSSMVHLPFDIRDILSRIIFDRLPTFVPSHQQLCRLSEPIIEKVFPIYQKLVLVKSFVVSKFIGSVTVAELSAMHSSIQNNTFLLFHTMYRRLNF